MALVTPKRFVRPGQAGVLSIAPYTAIPAVTPTNLLTTVIPALEALSYTDFGDFEDLVGTTNFDNEQEYLSDKCGVGSFSKTFTAREVMGFNWKDNAQLNLYNQFLPMYYQTASGERAVGYNFADVEIPFTIWRFVACDLEGFDETGAVNPATKIIDTHYFVKMTLTSEFAKGYTALGNNKTFEGSDLEFTGEKGGLYIFHREAVAI